MPASSRIISKTRPTCGREGVGAQRREAPQGCSSTEKILGRWSAQRKSTGSSCSRTGNRRIPVRSPVAEAPSASCTGEASPLWSAVCSQPRMGGRHPGVKMTRGGGRLTSRVPTEARSASAPQGRQAPGRRPACDAMAINGDREGESDEQPTGQTRDGRAGHWHEGYHVRAGQRAVSRALKRRDAWARPPGCRSGWRCSPLAAVALWRGASVESRRHNLAPDPDALTRPLPACWEVCRMPRRTSGKRLSSPYGQNIQTPCSLTSYAAPMMHAST
jgi:hypothetical protein